MGNGSSKPSELEKKLFEQIKCPICLEAYKTPRSLTCLHTFCEGCIQSHILQQSGNRIQCPICRAHTVLRSPNRSRSDWAKELPVNSALVPLLEAMVSASQLDCDNCRETDKKAAAVSFCSGCKQYQCEECVAIHTKLKLLKDHTVVPIEELSAGKAALMDLGSLEFCERHPNQEVKFYCDDDQELFCRDCAFLHHRSCNTVTEVDQLGRTLAETGRLAHLQTDMAELQQKLAGFEVGLEGNLSDLEKQEDKIIQEIKGIREQVLKMLDDLVAKVTAECGQMKKQHTTELADRVTSIKSLEAAIITSCSLLDSLVNHGTEAQMFIVSRKLDKQLREYEKRVKETGRDSKCVELSLSCSKTLTKILQAAGSLTAHVAAKFSDLGDVPIAECVIRKLPEVEIQKEGQGKQPCYRGLERLPDGQMVGADCYNSRCCLMDDLLRVTDSVRLSSPPSDLTVVGETEVVVVQPATKQLQCVSIQGAKLNLGRVLQCTRTPFTVSRVGNTEVAVGYDIGMGIMSLDGTERFYAEKDKSGRDIKFFWHDRILADVEMQRVYCSTEAGHAVYRSSFTGEVQFVYTNNLSSPCGLALDRDHNLYVCSRGTHRVQQVSPDGQLIREIDPGITSPYTACFNPTGDTITVMDAYSVSTKATKFMFVPE